MKIELLPNEIKIDTWVILYQPPDGSSYNGKLTITNKRLLYHAKTDVSDQDILVKAFNIKWGSMGYVEIDKSAIKDVQVEKNFLVKKAIITLADDTKHIFNYGALNIDMVVEAIRTN